MRHNHHRAVLEVGTGTEMLDTEELTSSTVGALPNFYGENTEAELSAGAQVWQKPARGLQYLVTLVAKHA